MAFRPYLLAAALLPSFVACGGDDEGNVTPEGPHYHYVANKVNVPATGTQAREFGLDLNGDGTTDNQLGMVLSTLGTMGLDVQSTIDTAVAEGSIVLLVDVQTEDFASSSAAGVQVFLGDDATVSPAACNPGESHNADTGVGCKRHLDGNGMFTIDAQSPTNAALGGKIAASTFTGGPGDLSLQIALGGTTAIQLDLIGARVKGSMLSEASLGSGTSGGLVFAGAITKEDIDGKVIPAIQQQLTPLIARDCTMLSSPPTCGCADGTTGKTLLGLLDAGTKDCMVSVDEIKNNSLIVSLLAPDVTVDGKMALSLGVKATATKATFTVAGQ